MRHTEIPDTLDPNRFTSTIRRQPEFLEELPQREVFSKLAPEKKREYIQRAIAASALSIAGRIEKKKGEYDLDANLYRLVGELGDFYDDQRTLESLREQYDSPRFMPDSERQLFYDAKENITQFNHTLREVINVGAAQFNFNDLLTFMTNMHIASNGRDTTGAFHEQARTAIIGMRNEMAFEQVLISGDYDYELGSVEQDATGGDFIIEGVPIDIKASERTAEEARDKARHEGRNPDLILWSHIHFEDYEGKLTLPYKKNADVLARVEGDIKQAISSYDAKAA